MTVLKHTYFISMLLIGSCVYVLQRLGIVLPYFIHNYLNDILAIPISLFIILAVVRFFRGKKYRLSIWMIASVIIYFSFYFEYYLPQFNPRYTGDLLDVCCYFSGGAIFYFIQRNVLNKHS